jgi:hypothetical protein
MRVFVLRAQGFPGCDAGFFHLVCHCIEPMRTRWKANKDANPVVAKQKLTFGAFVRRMGATGTMARS